MICLPIPPRTMYKIWLPGYFISILAAAVALLVKANNSVLAEMMIPVWRGIVRPTDNSGA
jgi:hypothetical protein